MSITKLINRLLNLFIPRKNVEVKGEKSSPVISELRDISSRRDVVALVWDTSAISNYFTYFKSIAKDPNIEIVIPEIVTNELSNGRHSSIVCAEACEYIKNTENGELKVYITPDKMRGWSADEQVIGITKRYLKNGYKAILITCDKNMAERAKRQNVNYILLKVNQPFNSKMFERTYINIPSIKVQQEQKIEDEVTIPCTINSGKTQISVKGGIQVYSPNGKRKIAKDFLVYVDKTDKLVMQGCYYKIKNIIGTNMYLKRMDCT